jgi:hypothetical protein
MIRVIDGYKETPKSARVISVVETISLRGNGKDDHIREVHQYWSVDGKLLAEHDPAADDERE